MTSNAQTERRCVSCGRPVDPDAATCPHCGYDLHPEAHVPRPPKPKRALWKVAVVSVVIAAVVLASILYVLSLGFGGCCSTPAVMVLNKSAFENGFKIEFTATTAEVSWNDVTIQLSTGTDTVSWKNISAEALTSAYPPEVWHYGNGKALPGLCVFLNVTDVSANGRMSHSDYITLTIGGGAFSTSTTYSLRLTYEPNGGQMMNDYAITG
jgi:hypothetical protein